MHWVHDNIEFFGGDPERITVSGQSAGATSADLLALSPYSRGAIFKINVPVIIASIRLKWLLIKNILCFRLN